jgi:hypothetical protein
MPVLLAGLKICPASFVHGTVSMQQAIKVDQVGYPLYNSKVVLLRASAETFEIMRLSDDVVFFHGKLAPLKPDPKAGRQDTVRAGLPGDLPAEKVYADRIESLCGQSGRHQLAGRDGVFVGSATAIKPRRSRGRIESCTADAGARLGTLVFAFPLCNTVV